MKLSHLQLNTPATVEEVRGRQKRRMTEIGFVPGAIVEPIMRSPSGDPTAYDIKGTLFAIRAEDAEDIIVQTFRAGMLNYRHGTI